MNKNEKKIKDFQKEIKRENKIRNDVVNSSKKYNSEYADEFYIVRPHNTDLYVQN